MLNAPVVTLQEIEPAIAREKLVKKWKKSFKIDAISRMNPTWNDLYEEIIK